MSKNYSIDQTTKTLVFTSNPKSLKTKSVERKDKQRAFERCAFLSSIYIPNSISNVGKWAFCDCSHLHKIFVPINSKVDITKGFAAFQSQTTILRNRFTPILALQKKPTCRASKAAYSIYL